jgi:large subunit ribosomal protein L5
MTTLRVVSGQQPVITRARRSVAGFHLRKGNPVGTKVTLRRERMYEFLDRLISIVLPRVRDFRGLSPNAFDGTGNYSLGIDETGVFPELDLDSLNHVFGLDVTIVTSARTDQEAYELLDMLGVPFRR